MEWARFLPTIKCGTFSSTTLVLVNCEQPVKTETTKNIRNSRHTGAPHVMASKLNKATLGCNDLAEILANLSRGSRRVEGQIIEVVRSTEKMARLPRY